MPKSNIIINFGLRKSISKPQFYLTNTLMKGNDTFKSSVIGMQGNLFSFALKLTANEEEAHDLVQDTTLKALDNEAKFTENANFGGWMMTIMRNIFINNYRKRTRENTVVDSTEDLFHLNLSQDSGVQTPDGAFAAQEITAILNGFPADYRKPFSMHIAGYKYEEISQKLAMPLGTVKSHIFFTRKKLREMLKDYR